MLAPSCGEILNCIDYIWHRALPFEVFKVNVSGCFCIHVGITKKYTPVVH